MVRLSHDSNFCWRRICAATGVIFAAFFIELLWNSAAFAGIEINDTDPSIVYSAGDPFTNTTDWYYFRGSGDYDGDEHSSNLARGGGSIQGAGAIITFNGTSITWIGKRGPNYGKAVYSIDGGYRATFDGYNSIELNQNPNVTISGLSPGSHVLQISLLASKNPASNNYWQTVDAFRIVGSPLAHSSGAIAGYNSSQLVFTGSWTRQQQPPYSPPNDDLSGGHDWSNVGGSSVSWTFTGSLIEVFCRPDLEDGYMEVYIDGNYVTTIDGHFGNVDDDAVNSYMLFAHKLYYGTHRIELVVTGTHDSGATNSYVQFDEFAAFP